MALPVAATVAYAVLALRSHARKRTTIALRASTAKSRVWGPLGRQRLSVAHACLRALGNSRGCHQRPGCRAWICDLESVEFRVANIALPHFHSLFLGLLRHMVRTQFLQFSS
jgi:hypothetical protein